MTIQSYLCILCVISITCNVLSVSFKKYTIFNFIGVCGSFTLALIISLIKLIYTQEITSGLFWLLAAIIWFYNVYNYFKSINKSAY